MNHRPTWLALAGFLLVAAATVWLRAPSFGHQVWNVDEAIHLAVARELLDGGTLYRDAIDQRTPLTYYAVAAVGAIAGENNIHALHLFTALLIAATSFLLWRAGVEWRRAAAGAWAAGLYSVLSVVLLYSGDAFAFNTEWALACFTALAAALVGRGLATRRDRWFLAAGVALALAFLSKQPAILDATAPVALFLFIVWRRPGERRPLFFHTLALAGGWLGTVGLVVLAFALGGALPDAIFYAWSYNVQVYGPEISTADRLASAFKLGQQFLEQTPLLLPWIVGAALWALARVSQRRVTIEEEAENPLLAFLLAWSATSFAGAVSGGRGFDHYFIQSLPPLCLLAGLLFDRTMRVVATPHRATVLRATAALALGATIWTLGAAALEQRRQTLPPDTSVRAARFVRERTTPDERIFVWGFHPEFYLFADRQAASRFVYGSFLTGLVPWTNVARDRDTAYAIVPGALDTLLAELEARRPVFFIDCSAGPNRFWDKYPLAKFPRLKAFVDRHYVLADPSQFRGQGFDLYLLRDSSRLTPPRASDGSAAAALASPGWFGPAKFANQPADVTITGSCANARLTRLELLLNGQVFAGVTFAPVATMSARLTVPFHELGFGAHTLQVRATAADGSVRESPVRTVEVADSLLPEEQLPPFSLPQVTSPIRPLFVQTLYGASVDVTDGGATFFAHAPSTIAFPLPPGARTIIGGFGFRPGAYAADNPTPTDGAEFRLELVGADGRRRTIFQRLLEPTTVDADRGVQSFTVRLPADRAPDEHLQFVITPGRADSAATDWTFWTDLRLESSR